MCPYRHVSIRIIVLDLQKNSLYTYMESKLRVTRRHELGNYSEITRQGAQSG
jgi:hypothetical protein